MTTSLPPCTRRRRTLTTLGLLLLALSPPAGLSAPPAAKPSVLVAGFKGPDAVKARAAAQDLERWLQTGPELRVVPAAAKPDPKKPAAYNLSGVLKPAAEGRLTVSVTDAKGKLAEAATGEADDVRYLIQQVANRISHRLTGAWLPAPKPKDAASPNAPKDASAIIAEALGGGKGPVKMTLAVDRGEGATYHFGEEVVVKLTVDRECYVTVYNVDSQGTVTVLFPNQFSGVNRLRPGQTYSIPGEEEDWAIEAGGIPGMELLSAVATLKPYRFPGTDGSKALTVFSKALTVFSKGLADQLREEPIPEGATSVTTRFFTLKDKSE